MKAKRRFNIWLGVLLCVPCLLASCDHDVHDGEGDGGLSVSLAWADEADEGTEVKDVKTWIVNTTDGTQVVQSQYGSAQEMAKERYDLPEGNYRILTTINLVDPFTISEQTRAVDNIKQSGNRTVESECFTRTCLLWRNRHRHRQGGCALYHKKRNAPYACRIDHHH